MWAISASARSNASWLAAEGFVVPLTLRTNCRAASWTSREVAGGSKLFSGRMLRHMASSLRRTPTRSQAQESHGVARYEHHATVGDRYRADPGDVCRRRDRHEPVVQPAVTDGQDGHPYPAAVPVADDGQQ